MSVKVMGSVFDIRGLSPTLKFVLLAYADHASHDGTGIWPAVKSIANKTGYSKRTIQNATKELEELGYMKKIGQHESGTNMWAISTPDMGGAGDSPPEGARDSSQGVQEIHTPRAGDSPEPLINHHINQEKEDINNNGIYTDLSVAFVNKTMIPELSPNPRKWFEALEKMGKAGVEPQDIESAVDILWERDYTIVGLSSIANTAINEMSKRQGKKGRVLTDEERRAKYTSGELGEFIEH